MSDATWNGASADAPPPPGANPESGLAPVLMQVEAARQAAVRLANTRRMIAIPLGAVLGYGLYWIVHRDHFGADLSLLAFPLAGAALGFLAAGIGPAEHYRRLYKQRVLPRLLARFGPLGYRQATVPDLSGLSREEVLPAYDEARGDDEIFGTYRGLSVSIIEFKLLAQEGKSTVVRFDGLLLRMITPNHLLGVTTVVADGGALAGLEGRFEHAGRQRVKLEDPLFEHAYDVYGTDQVEARALLTPVFMERFMALGARPGWNRPQLFAENQRLAVTLPKQGSRDLFEPPPMGQDAENGPALQRIQDDLAAVLAIVDALIDCAAPAAA